MGLQRALVVVVGLALAGTGATAHEVQGDKPVEPKAEAEQAWNPEGPAQGPVQLVVSLPEQRIYVYESGKLVTRSPVSSGQEGYPTPTGVFSILQKRRYHRSNIYSRAPMPYMQRLTWSGIALHASNHVPDYPASHGCVRLPTEFAKKLFRYTELGAHVVISSSGPEPAPISHETLFQPAPPRQLAALGADATGEAAVAAPLLTAASSAEASRAASRLKRADAAAGPGEADRFEAGAPLRVLVTRRTGRELISDAQRLLKALGFDPGDIDGWMGPDTGRAIRRFQEANGLRTTGAMSDELVAQLYEAAGKGAPPTGHIYVRRNFRPVFDAPIVIAEPDKPLGAHLFTTGPFEAGATRAPWLAVSLNDRVPDRLRPEPEEQGSAEDPEDAFGAAPVSAEEALSRIDIPAPIRRRIAEMLTPGSSLAITDRGISKETIAKGTDFVVLTRPGEGLPADDPQ